MKALHKFQQNNVKYQSHENVTLNVIICKYFGVKYNINNIEIINSF